MSNHRASSKASIAPAACAGAKAARAELRQVEEEIDRAAAALWGLAAQELADVRASLQELKGQPTRKETQRSFEAGGVVRFRGG